MKLTVTSFAASLLLAGPVFADAHASGDAAAGEDAFKNCKTCHAIIDAEGTEIQRGAKVGPNLYGVLGRQLGSVEDFRYSDGLVAVGETGVVWDEATFVAWTLDPSAYLSDTLGSRERSKMTYKLRDEEDAINLWAYLVSVGPEVDAEEAAVSN
ncbi:MAG: cytochrome C [Yoonia sp.]|nr:cytochrome C [Yoonia sp.]